MQLNHQDMTSAGKEPREGLVSAHFFVSKALNKTSVKLLLLSFFF